jgi:surface antigen
MTPNSRWAPGLLLSVLVMAMPASAANLGFMKDGPFMRFTEEDHAIFSKTLDDTLSNATDGEARTWSNPKSRANGEMKPVKSFERDRLSCRTLSITNKANASADATGRYNFCKQDSGKWTLAN